MKYPKIFQLILVLTAFYLNIQIRLAQDLLLNKLKVLDESPTDINYIPYLCIHKYH